MSAKWSASTLTAARGIWGLIAGSVLVYAAVKFAPHMLEDGLTRDELFLAVLYLGVALLAARPDTAFQLIGKGVELWEKRKSGGAE